MQGEPPNPEEERRLCYVGMTRAKEKLYLTRAAARVRRGKEVPRTPARFLDDLPAHLVERQDLAGPPVGPMTEKEKSFFSGLAERLKAESGA
jgi:DNA helicase-2/ATP-dependent DNA helicase PcrA